MWLLDVLLKSQTYLRLGKPSQLDKRDSKTHWGVISQHPNMWHKGFTGQIELF